MSDLTARPARLYFILASGSPRRREFLEVMGVPFVVMRPTHGPNRAEIDETPLPGESPAGLVQRLSRLKARAVLAALPPLATLPFNIPVEDDPDNKVVVIAADTVVALDDEILGKPSGPTEAAATLRRLGGRRHQVYSGVTVASPDTSESTRLHESTVWMRPYSEADIAAYVSSGAPLDKAGAYGIQDHLFAPVERLEGCYASVMGLPLGELALALADIGVSLPHPGAPCARHTGQPCCTLP